MERNRSQLRGALLLTLTGFIWGVAFVAQSVGMDYLGPCAFNGVRNFIGGAALLPVIAFASRLRQAGIRTQLYTEQKKFKAKVSYADKLNIPFAVFLGEDEIKAGAATVKNLRMANDFSPEEIQRMEAEGMYKQVTLPVEEALGYLRKQLGQRPAEVPIREATTDANLSEPSLNIDLSQFV